MNDMTLPFAGEATARALLDAIAVPAALHRGGPVIAANEALQRLCGLDAATLSRRPFRELVVPDDRPGVQEAADLCLTRTDDPPARAATLQTAGGGTRQVEITQRRLVLDGEPTVVLTCVDLSDVHHVQSSLFALSDLLRQIVDSGPVPSYVIDLSHRVTHWNLACERLTGLSAAQMVGRTDTWRAFHASARPTLADLVVDGAHEAQLSALYGPQARPHRAEDGFCEVEAFFPHLGDAGRWLYLTAAPLRNGEGQVTGAVASLQDTTQRREAEQELRRHRQRLEELVEARSRALAHSVQALETFVDNAPIAVVYSTRRQVQRCNRAMETLFGLQPGQALGLHAREFFASPEDMERMLEVIAPELLAGRPAHIEGWMRHHDGHPVWVQLHAFMPDTADPEMGTWWMMQDRTEVRAAGERLREQNEHLRETNRRLEEAQNQLLQSEKMASIGQLAAGVAHEINNPIGFVSSNLHTLRQYIDDVLRLVDAGEAFLQAPGDGAARQHLLQLRDAIELEYLREDLPALLSESAEGLGRVKKIVQDLKDFSRVDQAEWQEADLNAGLESTLNVVRNEVKYKADVRLELGALPPVRCLAGQLNQVFMNLIVNAAHAIAQRGVITLRSGQQGGWAWVEVADTGCGMSPEIQRRIFEPFFTTKEVGQGTGLGLSLAFSIVQRHGGRLDVRSTVGVGSRFRVWVPVDGPESPAAAHSPVWEADE